MFRDSGKDDSDVWQIDDGVDGACPSLLDRSLLCVSLQLCTWQPIKLLLLRQTQAPRSGNVVLVLIVLGLQSLRREPDLVLVEAALE